MEQIIFLQIYFKIILYLYQLKNTLNFFSGTTWIDLWKPNGMSEENIENVTKSDINFARNFDDQHVIPDINFNEH